MAQQNLYCKLFIDADIAREELINMITEFTNGRRKLFRTIITDFCEIDVNDNDDYYTEQKPDNDFLYYKFFLDIEPGLDIEVTQYIHSIAELIKMFASKEINTVPACDFENKLSSLDTGR